MNSYEGPWRNRPRHLYTQYCYLDEAPPKLVKLIQRYGSAFDDEWFYKLSGHTRKIVTRRPLWLSKGEGGWYAEKVDHDKSQRLLEEFPGYRVRDARGQTSSMVAQPETITKERCWKCGSRLVDKGLYLLCPSCKRVRKWKVRHWWKTREYRRAKPGPCHG